jgi:hypothetical protein
MISLDRVPDDSSNPTAYFDGLTKQLQQQYPDLTSEKVTSPLGEGRAFLLKRDIGDGQVTHIRSEFYPVDKMWVVVKLQHDAKSEDVALPEFVKARKSLQSLKP